MIHREPTTTTLVKRRESSPNKYCSIDIYSHIKGEDSSCYHTINISDDSADSGSEDDTILHEKGMFVSSDQSYSLLNNIVDKKGKKQVMYDDSSRIHSKSLLDISSQIKKMWKFCFGKNKYCTFDTTLTKHNQQCYKCD